VGLASDLPRLLGCSHLTPGMFGDGCKACSWIAGLAASCAVDGLGVHSWKAWLCVSVTVMGGMIGGGRNPEECLGVMHCPASCCFSLLLQVSLDGLWMPLLGLIWLSGLAFLRFTGAGDIFEARLMPQLVWVLCRKGSWVLAALSLSRGWGDAGACTDSCCPFWVLAVATGTL